ncbi:MAG: hypothetical protein ChlgKO_07360 [Chlamydiales bacterium]
MKDREFLNRIRVESLSFFTKDLPHTEKEFKNGYLDATQDWYRIKTGSRKTTINPYLYKKLDDFFEKATDCFYYAEVLQQDIIRGDQKLNKMWSELQNTARLLQRDPWV